jgi:hypothetical protein
MFTMEEEVRNRVVKGRETCKDKTTLQVSVAYLICIYINCVDGDEI